MRKSRILCIEIFQTTEELHWQAKNFLRVKSEKKYMCCSCICPQRNSLQCCLRTLLSVTSHWAFDIREYEHRNS